MPIIKMGHAVRREFARFAMSTKGIKTVAVDAQRAPLAVHPEPDREHHEHAEEHALLVAEERLRPGVHGTGEREEHVGALQALEADADHDQPT